MFLTFSLNEQTYNILLIICIFSKVHSCRIILASNIYLFLIPNSAFVQRIRERKCAYLTVHCAQLSVILITHVYLADTASP